MATPEDRLAAYFDTSQPREPFNDEQIETIALLLARCSHATERLAQRSPRTYIIFRMIGQRDLVPRLLSEGFGDDWFPVTSRGLPGFLDPRLRTIVVDTQHIILTKSLDLENGQHCNYSLEEQRPFTVRSYIGSGSFGQVRVIESRVTYKQYALKTIRRHIAFGTKSKEIMSIFKAEMKIMKLLQHRHIVRYIGSFTDRNDLGLLMSPVADCDLEVYLDKAHKTPECHPTLRTFFGCLATALSYLHDKGVKHRDIKPKNVLVHNASVLLTDFGISRDFLDTTTGPTTATQRYCSPEVANHEGRNASTDVWSLGCVFLEIQSALQTKDLLWVKAYYETHGTGSTHYHANPKATFELLGELRSTTVDGYQALPLLWIENMLTVDRRARSTAAEVMNQITSADSLVSFRYSCDQCSYPSNEPELVEYMEESTLDTRHPAQDSNDQQATISATPATDVSQSSVGPLPPSSFLSVILRTLNKAPEVVSSPVILGPYSEGIDALTDKERCQEGDMVKQKKKDRIKCTVGQEKHFDRAASFVGDELGSRASFSQGVSEPHIISGFDELTIASSCSETSPAKFGSIAASSTEQIPQCVDAFPVGKYGPGMCPLYPKRDGVSKGPFTFTFRRSETKWKGWVPNIVVCCTQEILKRTSKHLFSRSTPQRLSNTPYPLSQNRFDYLRKTLRINTTVEMKKEEIQTVLLKYLGCLAIPIIPEDALRRWPESDVGKKCRVHRAFGLPTLEHCLAIQDLECDRRDLLGYLLLYMAKYSSASTDVTATHLAMMYGPYICGRNYEQEREQSILVFLIDQAEQISEKFRQARNVKGELRDTLVLKLELAKQEIAAIAEDESIPDHRQSLLQLKLNGINGKT